MSRKISVRTFGKNRGKIVIEGASGFFGIVGTKFAELLEA
jgi:hypothetical protein